MQHLYKMVQYFRNAVTALLSDYICIYKYNEFLPTYHVPNKTVLAMIGQICITWWFYDSIDIRSVSKVCFSYRVYVLLFYIAFKSSIRDPNYTIHCNEPT